MNRYSVIPIATMNETFVSPYPKNSISEMVLRRKKGDEPSPNAWFVPYSPPPELTTESGEE